MTRTVAYTAGSLVLATALAACHPNEGSEFASGVPRESTVAMQVPGGSAKALTVEGSTHALQGQLSEWYVTTRAVSVTVNAGALAVGTLVRLVTDYPPTSITMDSAVWGPWQGPLDPVEWMVTVTRVAPHQYQYKFEGRDKHDPSAAFVTVLSGAHTPGLDAAGNEMEGFGSGSFTLDWNARATLPGPDGNVGTANYTYDHVGPASVVNIQAKFVQVRDNDHPGKLVDVNYAYMQNPQADGSMDFSYSVPASAADAGGLGKVKSRWMWNGAGRSDASVTPTNLALTYTVSECWNENYMSVYKSVPLSSAPSDNYGSEADCAFTTAMFSSQ